MNPLKGIFSIGVDKALDSLKGVVTTFVKDKALGQQIEAEMVKAANELKMAEMEFDKSVIASEVADRASARAMNIETMKNDDKFIRRFPVYLAYSVVVLCFVSLIGLYFVPVPDANRDMLNFIQASLFTGGLGTIVGFYFGASYAKTNNSRK